MTISPARRIAFDVLRDVDPGASGRGAYATDLLHTRLRKTKNPEDAALATELVLGVLRWQRLLDFLIARHLRQPLERLDPEVALALRLGVYQLRMLERIPAHAAVNESVELVKRARKRSAAALVNAILRRAAAEARAPVEALLPQGGTSELPAAETLGILSSHPTWLVQRWLTRFGEAATLALLRTNNRRPALVCALHDLSQRDATIASLAKEGFQVEPGFWLHSALRIAVGSKPLTESQAYRSGWISIQDEASQMVPLLLGTEAGDAVLDLCAAPGGKTVALARAAGAAARVIAADLRLHRLRAMAELLARTATQNVALVALDATAPLPFSAPVSRILLDAPCSGTGTLARNPEIRWRLTPADLLALQQLQAGMLANALGVLAPGGRLVYATCSLEREENEDVVSTVLTRREEFHLVDPRTILAPRLSAGAAAEGLFTDTFWFRTFPPTHGTDGFCAVVIERRYPSEIAATATLKLRDRCHAQRS